MPDSISENSDSISNSNHSHTAYTLIFEVKRVIDIEKAIVGIGIQASIL